MKKLATLMAAALLGAILGIACGGSKAPAQEPVPPTGGGDDTYGAPAYGGDAYGTEGGTEGTTPEGGGEEAGGGEEGGGDEP